VNFRQWKRSNLRWIIRLGDMHQPDRMIGRVERQKRLLDAGSQ